MRRAATSALAVCAISLFGPHAGPLNVAAPCPRTLYAVSMAGRANGRTTLSIVDIPSWRISTTVPLPYPQPRSIAVDPAGRVWVTYSARRERAAVKKVGSRYAGLRWLAASTAATKGLATRSAQLLENIRNDKPLELVDRLDGYLRGISGAKGILVARSQLVAAKSRPFFGPDDSAAVRAIYDDYRSVQSGAGILWAAYQVTKPDEWDPEDIATDIERILDIIEEQGMPAYLKPAVPADCFVDMRTRIMWTRTLDLRVNGLEYEQTYRTPRDPRFAGFRPPAIKDLEQLVQGRGDQKAAEWLEKTAKTTGFLNGRVWVENSILDFTSGLRNLNRHIRFRWFNLSTGKFVQNCAGAPYLGCPAYCIPKLSGDTRGCAKAREQTLRKESAFLMYKRPLAAGEQYWFD